jgi:hypothetical protein
LVSKNKNGRVGNMAEKKGKLVGKIILEIQKQDEENWYSKVIPVMLTQDVRDYTKLALITAAVQQYMRDSLGFINNIVKNSKDLEEMKMHLTQGKIEPKKEKVVPDTVKNQMPLPLGPKTERTDCSKPNCTYKDTGCGDCEVPESERSCNKQEKADDDKGNTS